MSDTPLTEQQADDGWCCRTECCGGGSWCCSHADRGHACSGDDELPGMWEHADFLGGDPGGRSYAERGWAGP